MFSERYENLLNYGRNSILEFVESGTPGETAIEPSLVGKFLDQIYNLNKYVFTTASTNYPGEKFQPFLSVLFC